MNFYHLFTVLVNSWETCAAESLFLTSNDFFYGVWSRANVFFLFSSQLAGSSRLPFCSWYYCNGEFLCLTISVIIIFEAVGIADALHFGIIDGVARETNCMDNHWSFTKPFPSLRFGAGLIKLGQT